jgi:hypothetical protein
MGNCCPRPHYLRVLSSSFSPDSSRCCGALIVVLEVEKFVRALIFAAESRGEATLDKYSRLGVVYARNRDDNHRSKGYCVTDSVME